MKYEDLEEVGGKKKGWDVKVETGTADGRKGSIPSAKRNPREKNSRDNIHNYIKNRKGFSAFTDK